MSVVQPPARLVVLAPNWLGDAVMALPLLDDLHNAWPQTHITVAARSAVAPLFTMVSGVGDVIRFEGSGRTALPRWRMDARRLEEGRFDAALLLPNSFLSAWMASQARIPQRWGFARDFRARLLTRAIPRPRADVHQSEYYAAIAIALGIPIGPRFAQIAISSNATERARDLLHGAGIANGKRFMVFAPGAAYGRAKQWLPERFAELAMLLANEEIRTVLVGTKADAEVCAEITRLTLRLADACSGQVTSLVDLSAQTDLPTLAAVMSLSDGTISNDSGAMHLAGATGTRVVAIFGPTDDRKTSPLRAHADAPAPVVVASNVWCRPCMLRECPIDHRCMSRVSARTVFEALSRQ